MEINGDQPPLIWPQFESTTYTRRRSPIPTMLVPAMIGVLSAAVFLLFTTFVVPPFLSVTSQILQPASVKRGWDSINVVLVLFAIICGVLARRNDDGSLIGEEQGQGAMIGETVGDDVYDADRLRIYESLSRLPATGGLPLRRSSSSYPDLRNGVFRETVDRRFRFYDDFEIDKYRSEESTVVIEEQFRSLSKTEIEESEAKEITVDKVVVTPSQQPPAPPPNPPPIRRTHRSVRNRDTQERSKRSDTSTRFKRTLPPPPPSPPPRTLQRRKSNAAKEIKMVFASLYNQGERKKKQKRKERRESPVVVEMEPPQYQSSIPPPPPPPPPLRSPQSVFYGLFKKGAKSKKIHSIPAPPPPPPPRKIQTDPQTPPL